MLKKLLLWINLISLVLMLIANAFFSTGWSQTPTVSDISHKYDTLFAPAGFAFSIWSVIFLLLICFSFHQITLAKTTDKYVRATGPWFILSNIANTLWLYVWVHEMLVASVIVIAFLLICLCVLTVRLRLELDDEPVRNIFFVWWPISVYLGWIMVATIACIAACLTQQGYSPTADVASWITVSVILIALVVYILLIVKRNLREAAGVGIWAFAAIAVRQWQAYDNIVIAAMIASIVLLAAIGIHAYKNRAYNIGVKLKRGEWK